MKRTSTKIRRNITLFPYFNFFRDFTPDAVISTICFAQVLNSYTKAMSLITISLVVEFFTEVPTGIISDKIGRKNTLMLAGICMVLKYVFAILGIIYISYPLLALSAIFRAIGMTFYSGTDTALLYETMGELKKKHKYYHAFGKTSSLLQLAMGVSAIVGGLVAQIYSFLWVFIIALLSQLVALGISLFFVEPKIVKRSKEKVSKHFWEGVKLIIKNPKLRFLTLASMIDRGTGFTAHSFQPVFFASLVPLWVVGLTRTLKNFGGFISFWFAGRVIDRFGHLRSLVWGSVYGKVVNLIAIAVSSYLTPFIASLGNLAFGISNSAKESLLQEEFSDKQRATMGSIISLFTTIFHSFMAIGAGYLADIYSPKVSLTVLYLLGLSAAFVYYKALKK